MKHDSPIKLCIGGALLPETVSWLSVPKGSDFTLSYVKLEQGSLVRLNLAQWIGEFIIID